MELHIKVSVSTISVASAEVYASKLGEKSDSMASAYFLEAVYSCITPYFHA